MDDRRARILSLAWTALLVALNLAALNFLVADWSTARLDLTENREFSISPATRRILGSLDDTVTIHGYFSKRTHPKLAPLVPRISDMLDEYRAVSRGRVEIEIVDPGENEEAERLASERFGVRSTPFQLASKYETGIVNAYFSLVVQYGDRYERYGFADLIDVRPLPDGDVEVRLRNLEYDLTRAIKKVTSGMREGLDLFGSLDRTARLTFIVTPDSLPEVLAEVPEAVRTAAEELEERGGDRFEFVEIVPDDEASRDLVYREYGARPMSLGLLGDESFYLYGVLEVGDRMEQLLLATGDLTAADVREAVEQSLRRYAPGMLKTVGVVAPEPSLPPEVLMQFQMQGRTPPTPPPEFDEVRRYLERDYNVLPVDLASESGVPYDVDLLLVLKPSEIDEQALFHLDQYLMRGGRVVLCAGNYDVNFDRNGLDVLPIRTGLEDWLAHFGVAVEPTLVLDDRNRPMPIPEAVDTPLGQILRWVMEPYPYLVQVRDDGFVNGQVAASLDSVGIYWGSPVRLDEELPEGLKATPILQSSPESWTSSDLSQVQFVDYTVPDETERHLLAVALDGQFESYFAERGAPAPDDAGEENGEEDGERDPAAAAVLERSPDTRLVVIGNAEFLSDFVAQALGNLDAGFFEENLRFAQNLIDWATLDRDMIGIRSRGAASRRLVTVNRAEEVALELASYSIPVLVLLGIGAWRFWKRRNTPPLPTGSRAGNEEG